MKNPAKNRRSVVGYVRVSTEDQASEGFSLDAQSVRIRDYCAAHGLELLEVLRDDGISGGSMTNRPGLLAALDAVKKGRARGLVSVSMDRLSRRPLDLLGIADAAKRQDWSLHLIRENANTAEPSGMMFFGVMASMAGYERDLIARRTSDAMSEMRRQGLRVGAVPFGWNLSADGRTLEKNEQEQEIIREVRSLREGGCSFAEIARTLNARSLTTKNGARWTHVQAQRILSLNYGEAA